MILKLAVTFYYIILSMLQNLPNRLFESIDEFTICENSKPLGVGSFGVVRKATHKLTGRDYAIKIITLHKNFSETDLLLLTREISIHYSLDHPHIIKLWAVLSHKNKVYMVMEYAENGNLFGMLSRRRALTEQEAFRYFYQTLSGVEHMHKSDVFHRDIKPENILLDSNMNVKICDFGWVADEIHRKRATFCGTYEYMSPEMVQESDYDYKIDIWALGILLFELLHCHAPFPAKSIDEIKRRFSTGTYEIKERSSEEYKHLIVSMLQFDPSRRIEIPEIKKSPWVLKCSQNKFQSCLSTEADRFISSCDYSTPMISMLKEVNGRDLEKRKDSDKIKKHKKYRTLQEEDLYCLGQNMASSLLKRHYPKQSRENQPRSRGEQQNRREQECKKKIIGMRVHTRTESNDLLVHKFGRVQKSKVPTREDRKRKPSNKRV